MYDPYFKEEVTEDSVMCLNSEAHCCVAHADSLTYTYTSHI